MRKRDLDIKLFSEVMQAVDHYNSLPNHFTQLDVTQKESLTTFWDKLFGGSWERITADYERWQSPNVHIVHQTWGSTACGWGGMGGAAMTNSYTVVIENKWAGFIAVYWDGRLAYIAEINDKLQKYKDNNYYHLPGLHKAKSELTLVYYHNPFPKK
jgi:hypothetical protein